MNNHFVGKSLWLAAGIGVGAGATWLYGTRSGRRARRQMVRMVEHGRERLADASRELMEKGEELIDRGKEFVGETGHRVAEGLRIAR